MFIKVKTSGQSPKYATKDSAGADLYAAAPVDLMGGEIKVIPTGTYIDQNYKPNLPVRLAKWTLRTFFGIYPELQIRPRSGLAVKGITVHNAPGTIDADYPKEIGVILQNASGVRYTAVPGERIAQLVGALVFRVKGCAESADERTGGYGSTGSKG